MSNHHIDWQELYVNDRELYIRDMELMAERGVELSIAFLHKVYLQERDRIHDLEIPSRQLQSPLQRPDCGTEATRFLPPGWEP